MIKLIWKAEDGCFLEEVVKLIRKVDACQPLADVNFADQRHATSLCLAVARGMLSTSTLTMLNRRAESARQMGMH